MKGKKGAIPIIFTVLLVIALGLAAWNACTIKEVAAAIPESVTERVIEKEDVINNNYFGYYEAKSFCEYVEKNGFEGVPVECVSIEERASQNAAAYYVPSEQKIYLVYELCNQSFMKNLWHEYGHYVWHKVMTPSEQDAYNQLYQENGYFVSEYAMTNSREDFAETFAYFKTEGKIKNNLLVDKYQFVKKYM